MIVPLGPEHIGQVARLHRAALKGLLFELGEAAARAFYSGCVRTGSAAGFVYIQKGEVRGFVLGSVRPDRLKRAILRSNPIGTLTGVFLGIFHRPAALALLVKSVRGPDEGSYDPREPELTYLAVAADCRTSGIGGSLVDAFTKAMRDAGVPGYELSVDDDNDGAAAFYERRGFKPIGRYREFNARHLRYRLELLSSRAK
jgi:ribosomal protein S18 acetylase RimI-like enzyme